MGHSGLEAILPGPGPGRGAGNCRTQGSPECRTISFCRWCLDMALSRPVTALDNERFTVQSVMLRYAVPVVLVCAAGPWRGQLGAGGSGTLGARLRQACEQRQEGPGVSRPVPGVGECEWSEGGVP